MQVGDLVQMKLAMFWRLKNNYHGQYYTKEPLLVLERSHNAIKLLYSDGRIKSGLIEDYKLINQLR